MTTPRLMISACLLASLLSGCASVPEGTYPSLAVRDVERNAGTLGEPAAPPYVPPPPTPATLGRLETLQADATAAHARFLAAAPSARRTVGAAAGAAAGTERWAQAQVAMGGLETIRSQAMIALADLDRIYVDAATGGEALGEVAAARDEVMGLVSAEDALLASLMETLR